MVGTGTDKRSRRWIGSRRGRGGAAEDERAADGEHPESEDEEAEEPDRGRHQKRDREARPAEPAGQHTKAQRRHRYGYDEEDRRKRPADEEQETDVLELPACGGVELELVVHRRKRRRPRHSVAG